MNAKQHIDEMIAGYDDWRGDLLSQLRHLINGTDANLREEVKWGTAVWTNNGLVVLFLHLKIM